jgi:predicted nucleic acid-binding protein
VTVVVRYLADVSALVRLDEPAVAAQLVPLIQAGEVAMCGVTELELLARVREREAYRAVREYRAPAFPWLDTTDADLRRALDGQALLLEGGHPAGAWPKLIVAAVGGRHGVTVLHSNEGFEVVAHVTGQATTVV